MKNFYKKIITITKQAQFDNFEQQYPIITEKIYNAALKGYDVISINDLSIEEINSLKLQGFNVFKKCNRYFINWKI